MLIIIDSLYLAILSIGITYGQYTPSPRPITTTLSALYLEIIHLYAVMLLATLPSLILAGAYRTPRKWHFPQASTAGIKVSLMSVIVWGIILSSGYITPISYGWLIILIFSGLLVGVTINRLLFHKIQVQCYRHGIGLYHSCIIGSQKDREKLKARLNTNLWMGEQVISFFAPSKLDSQSHHADDLVAHIHKHDIDVIWLAPPKIVDIAWLPKSIFTPENNQVIWRMLPQDYWYLMKQLSPHLSDYQYKILQRKIQHTFSLSPYSIALLGSRGIPASYSGVETYAEEVGAY